jgi:hypothetical protein
MIAAFGLRRRLIAGCAIVATLLYLTIVMMHYFAERDVAPYNDMIAAEHFVKAVFLPHWSFFTAFTFDDNQHRPVFPLYVVAIDHVFFASHGVFPLVLSWLSIGGVCLISLRRLAPAIGDPATRFGFLLVLPCFMFWPGHYTNLVWAKQFHACLSLLCICATYSLAAGLDTRSGTEMVRGDRVRLALLPPLIFVGTFSFAWGLIAGLALAAFVVWRRWPLLRAAPILLTVALSGGIYAVVWHTFHRVSPDLFHSSPANAVEYLLLFVGAPFWWLAGAGMTEDAMARTIAEIFGAIGLFLALLSLGRHWRRPAAPSPANGEARSYAELLILFGLGCAAMTMIARVSLGPAEALVSRYLYAPGVFWLALLFSFSGLPWLSARRWRLPLVAVIGLAFAIIATTPTYFSVMADRAASRRLGTVAAVMGEDGIGLPPKLRRSNEFMHDIFADYAARGASVYADGWPGWLGQAAVAIIPPGMRTCKGALDISQPVPDSRDQRVDGWIWDPVLGDARGWLALAGRDGRIIGLATSGFPGPDADQNATGLPADLADFLRNDRHLEFPRSGAVQRTGFVGYLRGDAKDVAEIYGWFGGSEWCRLTIAG